MGHGALDLLGGTSNTPRGSHSFFESDLLPQTRTIELSSPYEPESPTETLQAPVPESLFLNRRWASHGVLSRVLDVFQDGSLLIVDSPGHLAGHINILARTGPLTSVYLAGDACHDRRIMTQERGIGEWEDTEGHVCCIHSDKKLAEQTIDRIRKLEQQGVEVIFAHDVDWEENPANRGRFFGAS